MACDKCWISPPGKKSYLVHLSNDLGEAHDIIVQTTCTHDMQEWVDEHAEDFPISRPKVIHIDEKAAAHVPILDLTN